MVDSDDEEVEDDEDEAGLGVSGESGESGEQNWEVRCVSPGHLRGVEWIYALGMKLLRFASTGKFSWSGLALKAWVVDGSTDPEGCVLANSGTRERNREAPSQSGWPVAEGSSSPSGEELSSVSDASGRSERL